MKTGSSAAPEIIHQGRASSYTVSDLEIQNYEFYVQALESCGAINQFTQLPLRCESQSEEPKNCPA
jgi:hypothetical protein